MLINRRDDGSVGGLMNACAHPGALPNPTQRGNARILVCRYHGWSFSGQGGRCLRIKDRQGEDPACYSLRPVPRVESYKGFVFATLNERAPPLADHLGAAATIIDLLADQSLEGMEVLPGVSSYTASTLPSNIPARHKASRPARTPCARAPSSAWAAVRRRRTPLPSPSGSTTCMRCTGGDCAKGSRHLMKEPDMIGKVWRGICQAVLLGACGVLAGLGLRAAEAAPSLDFAGYAIQPAAVPGEAERFGGISGLDFDREAGRFVAITDARNAAGQGAPRYYTFRIEAGGEGGYRLAGIESHPLRPPGDAAFPAGAVSAEAIRLAPDGGFYWASEGECGTSQPTLWRNAPGMAAAAPLPIRTDYHYPEKCVRQPEPGLTGARDNGALESLALSPDGATLYYAAEYPLLQDMDAAAAGEHAVRITATPADGGSAAVRQFAYILPEPFGVTEMLTLGTGRFLVLEREYFGRKKATVSHLALATLGDATDLAAPGTAVLKAGAFVPMQRQELLVLNGSMTANAAANLFGSGAPMDNLEAMAWGCAAGTPVLAVAADDNFNAFGSQQNLFLLFRVTGGVNACEAD